jgi:transcriptional antiterminator Rof (Rho-off)
MNKDLYQSVSCDLHSQLELAIMHKDKLRIKLNDTKDIVLQGMPFDIVSRKNQGEFLLIKTSSGNNKSVRLDRIKTFAKVES